MGNDERGSRRGMRSIQGGRSTGFRVAGLPVALAEPEKLPAELVALVVEDDTYLVLGASPDFTEPNEHPIRTWTRLHATQPVPTGTVRIRAGRPLRLHAVVHDLSEDPTWRDDWIREALAGVLHVVGHRSLSNLALPVLGGVHGKLSAERFLDLLRDSLEAVRPGCLERLWLVTHPGAEDEIRRSLT